MGATVGLMTVEEFRKLPDVPGKRVELHDGEVFEMTFPKLRHWKIQNRLVEILRDRLKPSGVVGVEFGFRPTDQHNLWAADAAFVRTARFDAIDPDDNLHGAPDFIIEVASPSNTASEF